MVLLCLVPASAHALLQKPAAQQGKGAIKPSDLPAFLAELHRISFALKNKPRTQEIVSLRDTLPGSWNVTSQGQTYSISTEPLRRFLSAHDVQKARTWVDLLAGEVGRSTVAQSAVPVNARAQLDEILARREFAAVHPPSIWDMLRARILAWLERLLVRLFGAMARYPIGARTVFWLVVIGGVLWIAVSLLRFWSRRDRMHHFRADEPLFASRTWQEWLQAAREAAGNGNFREAVHSSYWAGIVRLQEIGILPNDRTKTPREYLRLASLSAAGVIVIAVATPAIGEPLTLLTSRLERTWYANRSATAEDFQDSLRQLKALGCQVE